VLCGLSKKKQSQKTKRNPKHWSCCGRRCVACCFHSYFRKLENAGCVCQIARGSGSGLIIEVFLAAGGNRSLQLIFFFWFGFVSGLFFGESGSFYSKGAAWGCPCFQKINERYFYDIIYNKVGSC